MGNIFGNGLGGLLGRAQAQEDAIRQQSQRALQGFGQFSGGALTAASSTTISDNSTGFILPETSMALAIKQPGPETALAWLDRRVAEIRVKL